MAEDRQLTDPHRFGLSSFAELLAPRDPIIGENPETYEAIHAGLLASLAPTTPYECLIAENLVAIEWELLQHRKMRDDFLRQKVLKGVFKAVVDVKEQAHDQAINDAYRAYIENGGKRDDWEDPFEFDRIGSQELARSLTDQAMSLDLATRADAAKELEAIGINLTEITNAAYFTGPIAYDGPVGDHEQAMINLEKRRREVLRDYDHLQKLRPIEAEVIEA